MFHVKHRRLFLISLHGEFVEHVGTDEVEHEEDHEAEELDGGEADDGVAEQEADDESGDEIERFHGGGVHRHALEQEETDGDDAADQEEDDARAAQLCWRQLGVGEVENQRRARHARRDAADAREESHEDGVAAAERKPVMRELHEQQGNQDDRADEQLQLIRREMREDPEAEGLRGDVADEDGPDQLVTSILPDEKRLHDAGEQRHDEHHENRLAQIVENHEQRRRDDHEPKSRDALHERSQPDG